MSTPTDQRDSRSSTPSGARSSTLNPTGTPTTANFAPIYHAAPKSQLESHPLHLVLSEISSVTSTMRKNTRWSVSSYATFSGLTSYSYSNTNLGRAAATGASTSALSLSTNATAVFDATLANNSVKTGDSTGQGLSASMGLRTNQKGKDAEPAAAAKKLGYTLGGDGRSEDGVGLLSGFAILRAQLREYQDFATFPLPLLLSPFLRVILSPRTTGPITSAAIQAVHRFLAYGLVSLSSPGAQLAIVEIAHATSHCHFEASEASADELVLLRILAVMRELICEPAEGSGVLTPMYEQDFRDGAPPRPRALADCLGDDSICEMMETGLSMCCQMRLSDLLRRTAEQAMTAMLRSLFSRLESIPTTVDEFYSSDPNAPEPEPEHETLAADPVGEDAELDEKKRRRMTMPDPTSKAFPAAAAQTLKEIGEAEEAVAKKEVASDEGKPEESAESEEKKQGKPAEKQQEEDVQAEQEQAEPDQTTTFAPLDVQPYGLLAMKEVLRVLVSLLDPTNPQHTDTMRLLGMSMLVSVMESSGKSIGRFPSLRAIIQDSACKHLFQLARTENTTLLSFSLQCISTLFETMREHLKLQHELFLTFLMDRLAPTFPLSVEPWNDRTFKRSATGTDGPTRTGTPDVGGAPPPPTPPLPKSLDRAPVQGEARELLLETMSLLFRSFDHSRPSDYLVDLWINYDCDTDCENLYEKVVRFLCRAVHATNPQHAQHQDSTQLFALDTLLSFIAAMTERQEYKADFEEIQLPGHTSYQALAEEKGKKASILAGAARFNAKPKDGLAYLEKEGLVNTSNTSVPREDSIARFLKECPRLDKKLLGDYLSRPDNIKVLQAFMGLFDFRNKPIAEALREMLEAFRLPGEAQQIDRVTQTFAKSYFTAEPEAIASEDAVYVLAFSVIMLNTDLHNPQNKRRMTVEDYARNLRGVNDGKDFDADYLGAIYDTIRRREIVMPEEHAGQLGFDYAWKELLRKSRTAGTLMAARTAVFDREMFENSWKPIFSSIAFAFSSFRDEYMVERAISGIRQCAILASKFGMAEIFDFMVHSLASATGLLDSSVPQSSMANATLQVEGQQITVSPLSVRFGVNFKGQLAAVVLFTIANGNGDAIRAGWTDIFEIFKNLFANVLLPAPMMQMYDLVEGNVAIPLKPKKMAGPSPQDPRAQGGGLFSTLSSYLLSPYSTGEPTPYEATEEDIEATLCTVDCVASCRMEELYEQIQHLAPESLVYAVQALKDLADSLTIEQERSLVTDGTLTPQSQHAASGPLPYDAKVVFALEMMVNISLGTPSQISETWSLALDHISSVLRSAKTYHPLLIEREVAAMLRLLQIASKEESLRDQLFLSLDLLRTLPTDSGSRQLLAGLKSILRASPNFARSQTEWGLIFALINDSASVRNADSAKLAFDTIKMIPVTADNFLHAVALLTEFANGSDTSRWRNMMLRESQQRRTTLTEKKEMAEVEKVMQERGVESVTVLEGYKSEMPRLVEGKDEQVRKAYWLALLSGLARQWINAHGPTRQAAIAMLQRTMLSPELMQTCTPGPLFTHVLFPMLDELLKPHGTFETRIPAAALVCKTMLHWLTEIKEDEIQPIWLGVLEYMDRLMSSSKRDPLTEAIPENLKNVLLVMSASNLLLPPPPKGEEDGRTPNQAALWAVTSDRIQRFLPGLMNEVFPPAAA